MFSDFYHSFYYSFLIIAATFCTLYFNKVDKAFRWLSFLVIITLLSELTAKYISIGLHKPNSIVYHIFTSVEYGMYAVIYKMFFNNSKRWNTFLIVSFIVLAISEIFNTVYLQPLLVSNTNIMIAESVLLVALSLGLFIRIRETPVYNNILKEGVFWFNSAVLVYYSFNILVWGFHNIKIYQLKNPPNIIYNINLLFSGLLYLVYAASVFLNYFSCRKTTMKA